MKIKSVLLGSVFLVTGCALAVPPADYHAQVDLARTQRIERLTKSDGWLTLIGLHFLQPGENRVGHAPDNQVVLTAGPAYFGKVAWSADRKLTYLPAPDAQAKIDGQPAPAGLSTLVVDGPKPTMVSSGTVSFFAVERGRKIGLRVKDSAAERRTHFLGLDYFPTDPSWRIEARWVAFDLPRPVPITNIIGNTSLEKSPGKAVFQREGKTYELTPIVEEPGEPLFFIFADATSGEQTYHMRFLYADLPKEGKIVLDFNRAYNPPCAFTPFATCPLPPRENQLPLAVTAGEKKYRGSDE